MKREVIQNFLNLPGIAGVALMDGKTRPYFLGIDQALNFQQKDALAQGIQQVVETTPSGFEFFEFQFTGHQVYIHKLDHGIILLVLTSSDLVYSDFSLITESLKTELRDDAANAIATFRLLAGNITLSRQNYWKRRTEPSSSRGGTSTSSTAKFNSSEQVASPASLPPQNSPSNPVKSAPPPIVTLKDVLVALNHVSQFATQYLGATVVANYWKSSRPDHGEWVGAFQIDRSARITLGEDQSSSAEHTLTSEQHQWIQEWTSAFIQRCSKVIRGFPAIIAQQALDDQQKRLLLIDKP